MFQYLDFLAEHLTCHSRIICHSKLRIAELSPFNTWLLLIPDSYD